MENDLQNFNLFYNCKVDFSPSSCFFLVVWKPRDYQVVEWPVAQWRFCILRRISWGGWSWAELEHCECLKLKPGQ